MREILFRAKRLDNGEWVEGYLASYNLICPDYPEETTNATGEYYGQTPYVGFIRVDLETVCQYTGRTDKNGVKIFEGDIVKDDLIFGSVVWDDPYIGFVINDIHDGHQEYSSWWNGLEVVGNIFDNPELLKGGADMRGEDK